MQKITPFLWFDDEAHDAAKFYVSLFKDAKITRVTHYGAAGPGKKGTVMSVTFKLAGQEFMALNGGPVFTFTPALSLFVNCKSQKEVDRLWEKLSKGGHIQQCGWLTDRYGVTWQIVPTVLGDLLESKNAEKVERVMKAMMGMIKLDIAGLEAAAHAKPEKDAKPAKEAKPSKEAKPAKTAKKSKAPAKAKKAKRATKATKKGK